MWKSGIYRTELNVDIWSLPDGAERGELEFKGRSLKRKTGVYRTELNENGSLQDGAERRELEFTGRS